VEVKEVDEEIGIEVRRIEFCQQPIRFFRRQKRSKTENPSKYLARRKIASEILSQQRGHIPIIDKI